MKSSHGATGTSPRGEGDGVTVYFGYPHAAEDDAVRAVRCGYELTQAILAAQDAVNADHGVMLAVRVGVDTGRTVIGGHSADARGSTLAFGEAPNIAARIESASKPNCCTISARTRAFVENDFVLEPLGPHALKGIAEPIELYCVTGVVESQARFAARARGGLSELVGRENERQQLRAACDAAPAGNRAAVLLTGEPGSANRAWYTRPGRMRRASSACRRCGPNAPPMCAARRSIRSWGARTPLAA